MKLLKYLLFFLEKALAYNHWLTQMQSSLLLNFLSDKKIDTIVETINMYTL